MDDTNDLCCDELRDLLERIIHEHFGLGCVSLKVSMFHSATGMTTVLISERHLRGLMVLSVLDEGERFDPDAACKRFVDRYNVLLDFLMGH